MVWRRGHADPARGVQALSEPGPAAIAAHRGRATLLAVCLTAAALMLNVTAPIVALGAIANGVDAGFTSLQWVLSAYALCLAIFQIGAGRIADLKGRRITFLVSSGLFIVASALCTLAPTATVMVVGRTAQGAAAAALTAAALALLAAEFEGRARSRAIGVWGGTLAMSFALGPVVGGILVELWSWRAIFAAGVPIGLLAALLVHARVGESRDCDAGRVDAAGVSVLAGALLLLMLGVLSGNSLGWGSPAVLASLAAGVGGLALFIRVERRRRNPILSPTWFANRTFSGAALLVFLMAASNFGAFVCVSYFLIVAREGSPLHVGLVLAVAALTTAAVSVLSGFRLERVPIPWRFAAGQALLAAGLVALIGADKDTGEAALIPGLALTGAGVGFTNPLSAQTHLSVMPPAMAGLAAGVNNTARQLGVAFGTALVGVLLEARARGVLESAGAVVGLPAGSRERVVDRLLSPDPDGASDLVDVAGREPLHRAFEGAYAAGLELALAVSAALAAAGIAVALLMVRERDLYDTGR